MKTIKLALMLALLTVLFISQSVQALKTNLHKKKNNMQCLDKGVKCGFDRQCCGKLVCRDKSCKEKN